MQLDEKFDFGRYKGLTLFDVFVGTNEVSTDLVKNFLAHSLNATNFLSFLSHEELILIDSFEFQIFDTVICARPAFSEAQMNIASELERLFRNRNSVAARVLGVLNIDEFNVKHYSKGKQKPELTGGNPQYIQWCIKKVDSFFVEPEELRKLQDELFFHFKGIELRYIKNNLYSYRSSSTVDAYRFPESIINLNFQKAKASFKKEDNYYHGQTSDQNDTYARYNGSYAQDVEGWSDQDIDAAFDGDPENIWNVE